MGGRARRSSRRSGEPIVRSRAFYGITERLGLDYSYDYRPYYTSRAWEDGFFAYLVLDRGPKPLTEFQHAYNDQARRPRRHRQPLDRRADGREAADRHRAARGRHARSRRSSSSTGTAAPTSASTSTRRPASRTPTPATTSARRATAASSSPGAARRPTTRRPASARARRQPRLVLRPLGRPRGVGRQLRRQQPRPRRRRRCPTTASRSSWEYGSYRPAAALPGDLGKVVRYVGLDLLFTSSPLYPPYFTADRLPGRVDLDVNTVEGWPGVDASRQYIKPRPVPRRR